MLARELISLLEKYPDSEVGFLEYTGCDTPFLTVEQVVFLKRETDVSSIMQDGGHFIYPDGFAEKDLILLRTGYNCDV